MSRPLRRQSVKTTVYLPEDLKTRLEAESAASGIKEAELIRQGIAMLLDASDRPKEARPLPVFSSGRAKTPEQLDDSIYAHVKDRAARR